MNSSHLVVMVVALAAACSKKEALPNGNAPPDGGGRPGEAAQHPEVEQPSETGRSQMQIKSSAFTDQGTIAKRYTCQGDDVSPPLSWSGAPPETKTFAFILDDPDAPDPAAPKRVWVHWVLYDLPAQTSSLAEGVQELPPGTREGKNDWNQTGYRGPCPPIGRHRYMHKLYALDTELPDLKAPTKSALEQAMKGHVLAEAKLIGTYQKE